LSQPGWSAYCRFTSASPRSETPTTKTILRRQIDRLAYELYDLTEDEIAIVEQTHDPTPYPVRRNGWSHPRVGIQPFICIKGRDSL